MADPGTTETGGPQADKMRQAETVRVASEISLKESRKKLADTSLPDDQRRKLQFGVDLYEKRSPQVPDIPRKATDQPGTDLYPPADALLQTKFADGTPISAKYNPGDIRISAILGADDDDHLVVVFKDKDDNDVLDPSGKRFAMPLTREEAFAAQVDAEPLYEEIAPDGTAKETVKAAREAALHEQGKGPAPTKLPSEDALQAVRDEYGIAAPTEPAEPTAEAAPQTPLEKADTIIAEQMKMLIEKLKKNPPDPELAAKKDRKAAEQLLFTLMISADAHGPAVAILKNDVLQQLTDSPLSLGDFKDAIFDLAQDELDARASIDLDIEFSGLKPKDIDELHDMLKNGDVMKLINDKRIKSIPAVPEKILGKDYIPNIKKMLKDSHIPKDAILTPEQEKAIDEAVTKGDHKTLLWIILALIAAPIIISVGIGVGGNKMVDALSPR